MDMRLKAQALAFGKKGQPRTKKTDIYCDMLIPTFESVTGLAAHF